MPKKNSYEVDGLLKASIRKIDDRNREPGEVIPQKNNNAKPSVSRKTGKPKGFNAYKFSTLEALRYKVLETINDYLNDNMDYVKTLYRHTINSLSVDIVIIDICIECQKKYPNDFTNEKMKAMLGAWSYSKEKKVNGVVFLQRDKSQIDAINAVDELKTILAKYLFDNDLMSYWKNDAVYGHTLYNYFRNHKECVRMSQNMTSYDTGWFALEKPKGFYEGLKKRRHDTLNHIKTSTRMYVELRNMFFCAMEVACESANQAFISKGNGKNILRNDDNLFMVLEDSINVYKHKKYITSAILYNIEKELAALDKKKLLIIFPEFVLINLISFFNVADGAFSFMTDSPLNPDRLCKDGAKILETQLEMLDPVIYGKINSVKHRLMNAIRFYERLGNNEKDQKIKKLADKSLELKREALLQMRDFCINKLNELTPETFIEKIMSEMDKGRKDTGVKISSAILNEMFIRVGEGFMSEGKNASKRKNILMENLHYVTRNSEMSKVNAEMQEIRKKLVEEHSKLEFVTIPKSLQVDMLSESNPEYSLEYNEEHGVYTAPMYAIKDNHLLFTNSQNLYLEQVFNSNSYTTNFKTRINACEKVDIYKSEQTLLTVKSLYENESNKYKNQTEAAKTALGIIQTDQLAIDQNRTEDITDVLKECDQDIFENTTIEDIDTENYNSKMNKKLNKIRKISAKTIE